MSLFRTQKRAVTRKVTELKTSFWCQKTRPCAGNFLTPWGALYVATFARRRPRPILRRTRSGQEDKNVTALAQGTSGVTRFDGHAAPPECHAAVQGRAGACGCRTPNTRPQHRPVREKKGKEKPRVPKPSTYRHRDPYRNTKFLGRKWPAKNLNLSGLKVHLVETKPRCLRIPHVISYLQFQIQVSGAKTLGASAPRRKSEKKFAKKKKTVRSKTSPLGIHTETKPRRNKPEASPDSPRASLPPNSNSDSWRKNSGRQSAIKEKRKKNRQKKNIRLTTKPIRFLDSPLAPPPPNSNSKFGANTFGASAPQRLSENKIPPSKISNLSGLKNKQRTNKPEASPDSPKKKCSLHHQADSIFR
ncbi:hypothetical protein PoB_002002200 [Plakobranchus ocellatus]|uniref:Uncharacterized protein n=1 Tax=Plakobranchus ocellatus TaxID=259542 RepID=A0AAV3ZG59_9GAST|nr:hypothetical protein PoB_002002200 [Plakobranchus ocellatus]